ncbi:MAG: NAD-dependent epimerase/dehydratase family protein [Cellvibrionaceae bacterium]
MNVFILGASGFIGNAVASEFLSRGDDVIGLCKTNESKRALRSQGVNGIVGDMADIDEWIHVAKKADIIIHAAHQRPKMRLSSSWLKKSQKLRDKCLSALVEVTKTEGRCRALIYTSGMIAFGNHGNDIIDESTPSVCSALGNYHLAGEDIIKQGALQGVPAFSIRPGMVYGNNGTFRKFFLDVADKGKYQYPGNGNNFLPFIHIDDLAKAYVLAADKAPTGKVISVVDDQPVKMQVMAESLLNNMGGGKASSVPQWIVGLFAGNALAEMLVGSYRVKNNLAKELLDWKPQFKSFKEGIPHVVGQYRDTVTHH